MNEELQALEGLYLIVPHTKENYHNYLLILRCIMELKELRNQQKARTCALLGG